MDLNRQATRRQPDGQRRQKYGVRLSDMEAETIYAAAPSGMALSRFIRVAVLRLCTGTKEPRQRKG